MTNVYGSFPPKHPDEKLDYQFDWAAQRNNTGLTDWLEPNEIILSYNLTVPLGLNLISSDLINDNTSVLLWIDGGTSGVDYPIVCEITTATRVGVRTSTLTVKSL